MFCCDYCYPPWAYFQGRTGYKSNHTKSYEAKILLFMTLLFWRELGRHIESLTGWISRKHHLLIQLLIWLLIYLCRFPAFQPMTSYFCSPSHGLFPSLANITEECQCKVQASLGFHSAVGAHNCQTVSHHLLKWFQNKILILWGTDRRNTRPVCMSEEAGKAGRTKGPGTSNTEKQK